ncbi:MAG: sigma 54-interacting transcriptional regulator [Bacteroidales bacterium]
MKLKYCERFDKVCYGDTELPLLFEISRMINNSRFIREVLTPIMELIAKYLNAERSLLSILNRENSKILLEAGYGLSNEALEKGKYLIGEGITGEVVKTGDSVYIDKISSDMRFLNKTGMRRKTKDNRDYSFICVPIKVDSEILGTLSIITIFDEKVNANETLRLLNVIGSMIAQSVKARQDRIEEIERLKFQNEKLKNALKEGFKPPNLVGNSSKIRELFDLIESVSATNATVLIRGESGVGKELIAAAIHKNSRRAKGGLIKVNCSALPESLIESELFGYEKGAFTGAESMHKGRFELADKGTIFLDEIGDLPLNVQVKLLRVIQEREFERLGGTKTIKTDVRIIAATNRNLEELIRNGTFREDLYYRINVFPLYIPPLRERISDIPLLVDHFIEKCNIQNNTQIKRISSSALDMLMIYHWPGNIRELENCIERAAILSKDGAIRSNNLPPTLQTAKSSNTELKGNLEQILERVEKQLIIDTLTNNRGNITKSAEKLGITSRILGLRIEKYRIDIKKYKRIIPQVNEP